MSCPKESLQKLAARLPELEWKLTSLRISLNPKKLPAGLFYDQFEMTPQTCIEEIKADLRALDRQKNERSSHFLAERICRKITVLVRVCQLDKGKHLSAKPHHFGVQTMSSRQQWLQTLQKDIDVLSEQEQALKTTLIKLQKDNDVNALLNLQAGLGEVERRLTLAKETLARATQTI